MNYKTSKKDYMLLSKTRLASIISSILPGFKVRCDIKDRNGKIGMLVNMVHSDFEKDKIVLELKNKEKVLLEDKFLYNLVYINNKSEYSLCEHDEYYEKIEVE